MIEDYHRWALHWLTATQKNSTLQLSPQLRAAVSHPSLSSRRRDCHSAAPHLPLAGASIRMERGCHQNDRSLADGYLSEFLSCLQIHRTRTGSCCSPPRCAAGVGDGEKLGRRLRPDHRRQVRHCLRVSTACATIRQCLSLAGRQQLLGRRESHHRRPHRTGLPLGHPPLPRCERPRPAQEQEAARPPDPGAAKQCGPVPALHLL